MAAHLLDSPVDTPALDYFVDSLGRPTMTLEEYAEHYQLRRQHAAHVEARFECNRFVQPDGSPVWHPYRSRDWDLPGSFARDLEASQHMISDSYGWAANRAAKVYYEALEENKRRG